MTIIMGKRLLNKLKMIEVKVKHIMKWIKRQDNMPTNLVMKMRKRMKMHLRRLKMK